MLHIIRSHAHYIFLGILCIVSAVVFGMAMVSYATYEAIRPPVVQKPQTSLQPLTLAKSDRQRPSSSPRPRPSETPSPSPTPTPPPLIPAVPDVRIPPVVDGLAPVVTSLPTSQPVVFLGIDDGAHKTPDELQTMQQNGIKATLFLSRLFIDDDPDFFKDYQTDGNIIEDHSLTHPIDIASIESYDVQHAEICGMADYDVEHYGRRPIFYRPPGGSYSIAMQRAAADCGMKAIVTWVAKANGGSMQYQIGDHLRPGDVVLMHFRPEFQQDMQAFLDAIHSQGLHTELLENWLQ